MNKLVVLLFLGVLFSGATGYKDLRRKEVKNVVEAKCGTAETNWKPCIPKNVVNRLFRSCCHQFVPKECHQLCTYDTDHISARRTLIDIVKQHKCSLKYMSSILYCASQNRDNRKCCMDLGLNSPSLQVGSQCLKMCDLSNGDMKTLSLNDVTCLYNWNVLMYCHHSGIKEL
uniref:DB domain-containing protein n=1 Tax=Rhabditophanes sp. KR3021 TaxID=114890 RepID=A0AC35U361_9BILA